MGPSFLQCSTAAQDIEYLRPVEENSPLLLPVMNTDLCMYFSGELVALCHTIAMVLLEYILIIFTKQNLYPNSRA